MQNPNINDSNDRSNAACLHQLHNNNCVCECSYEVPHALWLGDKIPLVNGVWHNWTVGAVNGSQGFTGIMSTLTTDIPWLFIFILAVVYIILLIITIQTPGRRKYATITFMGMLTSVIFELFGLVGTVVVGATAGLWIITTFLIIAGGD